MNENKIENIASYFINLNPFIDCLRLQQYLFYFNIFYFSKNKVFYFPKNTFRLYKYGPINFDVWLKWAAFYKDDDLIKLSKQKLNKEILDVVDDVVNTFQNYSEKELTNKIYKDLDIIKNDNISQNKLKKITKLYVYL